MTNTKGLMVLSLSIALLTGCGSSSDDNAEVTGLNTHAEASINVIGNWMTGCVNRNGDNSSGKEIITFNVDGTGAYEGIDYKDYGCFASNELETWGGAFTYKVGEATTGAAGEDTVEMDFLLDIEGNHYSMLHFSAVNMFLIADGDENTGNTPETRQNIFENNEDWVYIKQ